MMIPGERDQEKGVRSFETQVFRVAPKTRLDQYLAKRFCYFSRMQWQALIEGGHVVLNGKASRPRQRISPGDFIQYRPSPKVEPSIDSNYEILFEDRHLLAVNKPAPCPTTRSGLYLFNTLEHLLEIYLGGQVGQAFWMLHRLDLETTGVVLVAKTLECRQSLYTQFSSGHVQKRYLCVSCGQRPLGHCFQDLPLGPQKNSRIRIKSYVNFNTAARPALTYFTTLGHCGGFFLLLCRLYTGRTNQIRVHLGAAGHWIVGDKLYFPDETIFLRYTSTGLTETDYQRLRHPRMLLHAYEVSFQHPATQECLTIRAPLKTDMKGFLKQVGLPAV